jgi:hypothetical protein
MQQKELQLLHTHMSEVVSLRRRECRLKLRASCTISRNLYSASAASDIAQSSRSDVIPAAAAASLITSAFITLIVFLLQGKKKSLSAEIHKLKFFPCTHYRDIFFLALAFFYSAVIKKKSSLFFKKSSSLLIPPFLPPSLEERITTSQ